MSLAKLKEKYDYRKPPANIEQPDLGPEHTHEFKSWQDSAPVSRLSIYMKEHGAAAGIRLCQSNGKPQLLFDPGLGCADIKTERWQIANNATMLMLDAADDLKDLAARGLLDLPMRPAGPPWDCLAYGAQTPKKSLLVKK